MGQAFIAERGLPGLCGGAENSRKIPKVLSGVFIFAARLPGLQFHGKVRLTFRCGVFKLTPAQLLQNAIVGNRSAEHWRRISHWRCMLRPPEQCKQLCN